MIQRTFTPLAVAFLIALAARSSRAEAPPHPLRPATVRDALAVNIHFLAPRDGEMALLKGLGVGRVRMDAGWHRVEKERGVYDFADLDTLMRELDAHGIRAMLILDYGNKLYSESNRTPPIAGEARAAFMRYAAATVARYKGRGVLWEIYNEPNNKPFWPPEPDGKAYAALAIDVARAIRAVAPDEVLCGPGLAGIDKAFLAKSLDAGLLDAVDAVTVHPYRHAGPETFADDLGWLRKQVIDRGGAEPIVAGEWGYPVVWVDATTQVNFLARQMLWGVSERMPLNVWYDWRRGGGYDGKFSIFGLVDPIPDGRGGFTLKATATYEAFAAVTRLLGDTAYAERLPLPPAGSTEEYLLAFDGGPAGRRYAFWTAGAARKARVPVPPGSYDLYDVFGRHFGTRVANHDGFEHNLSGSPIYLVPTPANAATQPTTDSIH